MRLSTIRIGGTTRAVRVDGDMLVDLGASDIGELLGHDGWAERARVTRKQQIPFGPFMITGAFLVILGGT